MMLRRVAILSAIALLAAVALLLMWQARDTTRYSAGFSQERFEKLALGMKRQEVYSLLGEPLSVREERALGQWCYDEKPQMLRRALGQYVLEGPIEPSPCVLFDSEGRAVQKTGSHLDPTVVGMTESQVLELLGEPKRRAAAREVTLHYTEPNGDGKFHARIVAIDSTDRISDLISYEYYD